MESLGGLVVMFLLIVLSSTLAKSLKRIQNRKSKHADRRLEIISEAISGARVVKFYGWERAFAARIAGVRAQEVVQLTKFALVRMLTLALSTATPSLTVRTGSGTLLNLEY